MVQYEWFTGGDEYYRWFNVVQSEYKDCNQTLENPNNQKQFYLVAVFGNCLATIAALENMVLVYLFLSRQKFRRSNMFFLAFVALFDAFVDLSYIPLLSGSVLFEYFESEFLLHAWAIYAKPVYAISNISMTASTCGIIAASYERHLATTRWIFQGFSTLKRATIQILVIFIAFLLKFSTYFEFEIFYRPQCSETLSKYLIRAATLNHIPAYGVFFKFWLRNIMTVLVPFFLLLYLNIRIIHALRKNDSSRKSSGPGNRKASNLKSAMGMREAMLSLAFGKASVQKHHDQVRRATRTLVLIACTYLFSHLLNVIVIVWELSDYESLLDHETFYSYSSDLISLLTLIGNAVRLPIYLTSDAEIRKALKALFNCSGRCRRRKNPPKIDPRLLVQLTSKETLTGLEAENGCNPPIAASKKRLSHFYY